MSNGPSPGMRPWIQYPCPVCDAPVGSICVNMGYAGYHSPRMDGPKITHRDLCKLAAGWLLSSTGRNLHAAIDELSFDGGQADAIGVSTPSPVCETELRARTYANHAAWVAKQRTKREAAHARKAGREPPVPNTDAPYWNPDGSPRMDWLDLYRAEKVKRLSGAPQIVVIECKRTRSDLLADLRAGKMRRYEAAATECYLLASREALAIKDSLYLTASESEGITALGLPSAWGLLTVTPRGGVHALRHAERLREPEPWEIQAWADRMLASYTFRTAREYERERRGE